jgi:predicted GIY-YIG superfamily endonuclease
MDTMGYETAKIYKLVCSDGYYYIGSTVRTLKLRFASHKHASKTTDTNAAYNHIKTLGWENVTIELVELFPCETKDQLLQRETWHISEHRGDAFCLNTRNPVKDKEAHNEKCKEYYQEHREEILQARKEYHQQHRDKLAVYNKEYASRNSDRLKEYYREYAIANRERRNQLARERRAKLRMVLQ